MPRYIVAFHVTQPGKTVEVGRTAIEADAPDTATFRAIDRDGSKYPWDVVTTTIDAWALGATAHTSGIHCAPLLDPAMKARTNIPDMRAWQQGWIATALATDPHMEAKDFEGCPSCGVEWDGRRKEFSLCSACQQQAMEA